MARTVRQSLIGQHRDGKPNDFRTIIRRDSRASTQRNHKVDRQLARVEFSAGDPEEVIGGKRRRASTRPSIYEW